MPRIEVTDDANGQPDLRPEMPATIEAKCDYEAVLQYHQEYLDDGGDARNRTYWARSLGWGAWHRYEVRATWSVVLPEKGE